MTIQKTTTGLPYPQPVDPPVVPQDIEFLAKAIEKKTSIPIYTGTVGIVEPYVGMVIFDKTTGVMGLQICTAVVGSNATWQRILGVYNAPAATSALQTGEGTVIYDVAEKCLKVRVSGAWVRVMQGSHIYFGATATSPPPQNNDIWFKF